MNDNTFLRLKTQETTLNAICNIIPQDIKAASPTPAEAEEKDEKVEVNTNDGPSGTPNSGKIILSDVDIMTKFLSPSSSGYKQRARLTTDALRSKVDEHIKELAEKFNPGTMLLSLENAYMIKGWIERKNLEDYLSLEPGTLDDHNHQVTKNLILYILRASKEINDRKKSSVMTLKATAVTFQLNGKNIAILSNIGALTNDRILAEYTTCKMTIKMAFSIIAFAMEKFITENPEPILEVQGLNWQQNKSIRMTMARPLNLLLTIDGVQCGYDWEEGDLSYKHKNVNGVDPSFAYGITFFGIYLYQVMKKRENPEKAVKIAHSSATRKVSRLIQAGYKVTFEKAKQAACMVRDAVRVPQEVRMSMGRLTTQGYIEEETKKLNDMYNKICLKLASYKKIDGSNKKKMEAARAKLVKIDAMLITELFNLSSNEHMLTIQYED